MTLSAAERSSDRNWRSVAFSAASGMLLIRPMSMHLGSDSRNSIRDFPYRRRPPANIMEATDCRPTGVMAAPWAVDLPPANSPQSYTQNSSPSRVDFWNAPNFEGEEPRRAHRATDR